MTRYDIQWSGEQGWWTIFDREQGKYLDWTFASSAEAGTKVAELIEKGKKGLLGRVPSPRPTKKRTFADHDANTRRNIVMRELAGNIVCSDCSYRHTGNESSGKPGIRIQSYRDFSTPNLCVDLVCENCGHLGEYTLKDNPFKIEPTVYSGKEIKNG